MYFVLSPLLYYIANLERISDFVTLESNGKHICNITYNELKSLVERFIYENSYGVDKNKMDLYISYICVMLVAD